VAATAGVVASAATAAVPQMNSRLESAITYLSPNIYSFITDYFTINYETKTPTLKDNLDFRVIADYSPDIKMGIC
jgi:hypothetical protein